jgi:putative peptide maturation dehydrogenase
MARVRRATHVFLRCRDTRVLDVEELLRGRLSIGARSEVVAVSLLTGEESPLTREELEALVDLPAEWTDLDELPEQARPLVADLARRGLVVGDDADPRLAELRRRDERLAAEQWHPYAALYHFGTRRSAAAEAAVEAAGGDPEELAAAEVSELFDRFGPPPDAFAEPDAEDVLELPLRRDWDPLADVLRERRTTRGFDDAATLPLEQLGLVLDAVFGCLATARIAGRLDVVRKSSPSGGGLHPVEVYPLVLGVESLEPGLYHYRPRTHALALVEPLDLEDGRAFAAAATAGQAFFASAHVLFLLTARFYRSYWKYRGHDRAYAVLLMDAAHLSQTLYLVCAAIGLGAFVTGAINRPTIEERLGVDPFGEGALAVAGCGIPGPRLVGEPEFVPFVPREA